MPSVGSRLSTRWQRSGTARPLVEGAGWSLVAQVVSKGSVATAAVVGARVLGVSGFGLLSALQAAVLLSSAVWDMGVSPMGTRDVAAGSMTARALLGDAVRVRLLLSPLWAAALAGLALLLHAPAQFSYLPLALLAIAGAASSFSTLLQSVVIANMGFRKVFSAQVWARGAAGVVVLAALPLGRSAGLILICAAFALGEVMTLLLTLPASLRVMRLEEGEPVGPRRSAMALLRSSSPYAANGILVLAYNRMDVLLVGALAGAYASGMYAPASRIQDAMQLAPSVAVTALTPIMAHRIGRARDRGGANRAFWLSTIASVGLAVPATALAYLLAGWAIPALLGPGYVAAVLPARVLLLSIPFIAASYPIVSRLQAEGRAGATTVMFIVGAIAGIGGIIVLTPRMGVLGACLAATLREPLILATGIVMIRRSGGREAHPTGADPGAVPDD